MTRKLDKTEVRYRLVGRDARIRCGTCAMFLPHDPAYVNFGLGACTLVKGEIYSSGVCNRWMPRKPPFDQEEHA